MLTELPENLAVINASNADLLKELRRIGDGTIHDIDYSPDGQWFALASSIGVWLWDANLRRPRRWLGQNIARHCVRFSQDSQLIAATGSGSNVTIWRVQTGEEIQQFKNDDEDFSEEVAFHPDCQRIFIARNDKVMLRNITTGQLESSVRLEKLISCVSCSPDGRIAGIGTLWGSVHLWDIEQQIVHLLAESIDRPMPARIVFIDDDTVAYGCEGTIIFLNWKTGEEFKRVVIDAQSLQDLRVSRSGRWMATAHWAWSIRLFNLDTEEVTMIKKNGGITVAFNPDETKLAFAKGGWNSGLEFFSLEDNKASRFPLYGSTAMGFSFSPDSSTFVYAAARGILCLVDVKTGRTIRVKTKVTYDPDSAVNILAFHPQLNVIFFSEQKGFQIWNLETDEVVDGPSLLRLYDNLSAVLHFDPQGQRVITTYDGLAIIDLTTSQTMQLLSKESGRINNALFTPDGRAVVASGSFKDGENQYETGIRMWNLETLQPVKTFQLLEGYATCLAVSPDGKWLAGGGGIGGGVTRTATAWVWDVASGKLAFSVQTKTHFGADIKLAAFSRDSSIAAFSDTSGDMLLWDVRQRQKIVTLSHHTSSLWNMEFSPDGKLLATVGGDGTLRLWGIEG